LLVEEKLAVEEAHPVETGEVMASAGSATL
jgi:hypothetical protein